MKNVYLDEIKLNEVLSDGIPVMTYNDLCEYQKLSIDRRLNPLYDRNKFDQLDHYAKHKKHSGFKTNLIKSLNVGYDYFGFIHEGFEYAVIYSQTPFEDKLYHKGEESHTYRTTKEERILYPKAKYKFLLSMNNFENCMGKLTSDKPIPLTMKEDIDSMAYIILMVKNSVGIALHSRLYDLHIVHRFDKYVEFKFTEKDLLYLFEKAYTEPKDIPLVIGNKIAEAYHRIKNDSVFDKLFDPDNNIFNPYAKMTKGGEKHGFKNKKKRNKKASKKTRKTSLQKNENHSKQSKPKSFKKGDKKVK